MLSTKQEWRDFEGYFLYLKGIDTKQFLKFIKSRISAIICLEGHKKNENEQEISKVVTETQNAFFLPVLSGGVGKPLMQVLDDLGMNPQNEQLLFVKIRWYLLICFKGTCV